MATFSNLLAEQLDDIRDMSRIIPNLKKMGKANFTTTVVDRRIDTLKELLAAVRKRDAVLRTSFPDEVAKDPYFKEHQLDLCKDTAEQSLDQLDAIRVSLTSIPAPIAKESPGTAVPKKKLPFPPIELPKFDGALDKWLSFRDRFTALVIKDVRLTDYERMHYLCTSVSGAAADAVNYLDITESNFPSAWKILTDRFENHRRIIDSFLTTFFSMPQSEPKNAESLHRLRDTTNSTLQSLKKLNRPIDHWDDLIVYTLTQKLDSASRADWEVVIRNQKTYPTYAELEAFLQSRGRMLEAMTNVNSSILTNKKALARVNVLSTGVTMSTCIVCKQDHPVFKCSTFQTYSASRRRQIIIKHNRCVNCFRAGHMAKQCTSPYRCRKCHELHHTLLHSDAAASSAMVTSPIADGEPIRSDIPTVLAQTTISDLTNQTTLLATARVKVHSPHGRSINVRALLDQGSEVTFVSENVAQLLRLPRSKLCIRIEGINDCQSVARQATIIKIGPIADASAHQDSAAIILPTLSKYSRRHGQWDSHWIHLQHLELADDPFSSAPIDVIIGANLYGSILREGLRVGQPDQPIAQNTAFGWILSGIINASSVGASSPRKAVHHGTYDQLTTALQKFWEIEDISAPVPLLPLDKQCEEHFVRTHSRTDNGRYRVRLPFAHPTMVNIGHSRQLALQSLLRQEKRLSRNASTAAAYAEFLSEYETLGHMTRVNSRSEDVQVCYIPHHAVVREHSATTRLRVVFNASSKTSNGRSLNDNLLPGPKLQTDLAAIILRWRQYRYVLTADIAKMYRQILIDPRDADFQRILWRSTPSDPVEDYRLGTVTYGTVSAPFLALRVLKQLTIDEGSKFPLAVPTLQMQTYVDDCIFGADTQDVAREARNQLISMLARGGFHLRKWASNSSSLIADLDASNCGLACDRDLGAKDGLTILGITWHPARDVFCFRIAAASLESTTKRLILSDIARVFDPLGWITPVVIDAKLLLKTLWELSCGWDDPIPADVQRKWKKFRADLTSLSALSIPRWTGADSTAQLELHGFADASSKAYAAVVYLRVSNRRDTISTSLIIAKSKVAPIKVQTIPRLELCAALLLAKLIDYTRDAMAIQAIPCHCWSDSSVVLEWLRQPPAKWNTFVANRVARIQELTRNASWHHVATADNPADCASRGLTPSELISHALWWSGPPWLNLPADLWPQSLPNAVSTNNVDMEERRSTVTHISQILTSWDLQTRFTCWNKLLRVTAIIIRFTKAVKREQCGLGSSPCDPSDRVRIRPVSAEIEAARIFWLRRVQTDLFPRELQDLKNSRIVSKTSPISALAPYLDTEGLIRARGRLRNAPWVDAAKYPIILGSHPLTRLLVSSTHQQLLHAGPQLTLTHLRQRYWILRARPFVRSILHQCIPCTRERAQLAEEYMGDLPSCRVGVTSRAFLHTGVDYAGPITVRRAAGRRGPLDKAYVAVFVCMTTKAMHLELVSDYSTEAFIAAYHRFASRRGCPTHMYTDNGTNFRGAERELRATFHSALQNATFQGTLATDGITWHFIPPSAPHFGGLWEAAVRSVKFHLHRCIGKHVLTFEAMTTLLCRIEACLNSRPLGSTSEHIDDYDVLTPGHFLIHGPIVSSPEPSVLSLRENRLSQWQVIQRLQEQFWTKWSRDYLHTLQQRPKWRTLQQLAKIGRVVLLADSGLPPSHWALGRIIACHPGEDGLIRVVTVKTSRSEYKRPITKLCFLPIDINSVEHQTMLTAGGASVVG